MMIFPNPMVMSLCSISYINTTHREKYSIEQFSYHCHFLSSPRWYNHSSNTADPAIIIYDTCQSLKTNDYSTTENERASFLTVGNDEHLTEEKPKIIQSNIFIWPVRKFK